MKKHDKNNIADKFFNSELEPDEEKKILLDDEILENDEALKAYFSVMSELHKDKLPEKNFDTKILNIISEDSAPEISRTISWQRIVGIAASILILLSVWFILENNQKPIYGTISDPDLAFAETKEILLNVSDKLNEGLKPASKTIKKIDKGIKNSKTIKKAEETIKNINNINKLNKTEDLLKSMTKVTVKAG
jgi:hypothetical protein